MIALTHMRTPNDKKLAESVEEIDLILGGHDHVYEIFQVLKLPVKGFAVAVSLSFTSENVSNVSLHRWMEGML